jgi:hypothetical protein
MGGSKTAILAQVGHFYSDGVGQDKTGANTGMSELNLNGLRFIIEVGVLPVVLLAAALVYPKFRSPPWPTTTAPILFRPASGASRAGLFST